MTNVETFAQWKVEVFARQIGIAEPVNAAYYLSLENWCLYGDRIFPIYGYPNQK